MSDAASAPRLPVVRARSILQKVRYDGNEWFGIDYNMNLYRGCCHGCIYCDSRSECYRIDDFDQVSVKFDALAILQRELRSRRVRGIVGVGAMSDTYNPFERTLRVTRGALELIEEFGFGVSVDTKSTLITRDIDVLSAIGAAGGAIAKITVTTADDQLARIIEPHAPSPSERFAALAELADAGVFCGVLFTPTLPFATDDDATVRGVVEGAAAAGARFVYHMTGVTMRDRQRDHFLRPHRSRGSHAARALSRGIRRPILLQQPPRNREPRPLPLAVQAARSALAHVRHHRRLQALPTYGSADEPVLSM